MLEQSKLDCLAVDEAHCISEWGHDFRPDYRHIQEVRQRFPRAVCLALTATATARVRGDIRRLLRIPSEGEFVSSFNRRNLFLAVERREDGLAQTIDFLEQHRGQSGIIYCGTRKQTDELTATLKANAWPAWPYHAGLEDDVRCRNQEQFIQAEAGLMVATIAFGMGIDKSNVRFILHYNMPKDMESYYQEIGRAGRDGLRSDCLLLYSWADVMVHKHFIKQGAPSQKGARYDRLRVMIDYAEARGCRRIPLLAYFGEKLAERCGHCDGCVPKRPPGWKRLLSALTRRRRPAVRPEPRRRFQEIGELFRGSESVEQIQKRYDIQRETVLNNLWRYHESGGRLDPKRLLGVSRLSKLDRERALAAFKRLGFQRLTPVHTALRGTISYDELRVLQLYLICGGDQP